jgi:hypothetical protein
VNDLRIKKWKMGKCSWCGEAIPVGGKFVWWPSVNDDGVPNGSCSMHPECDVAYRRSGRETFPKFEFVRGVEEKKPEIIAAEEKAEEIKALKWAWDNGKSARSRKRYE